MNNTLLVLHSPKVGFSINVYRIRMWHKYNCIWVVFVTHQHIGENWKRCNKTVITNYYRDAGVLIVDQLFCKLLLATCHFISSVLSVSWLAERPHYSTSRHRHHSVQVSSGSSYVTDRLVSEARWYNACIHRLAFTHSVQCMTCPHQLQFMWGFYT